MEIFSTTIALEREGTSVPSPRTKDAKRMISACSAGPIGRTDTISRPMLVARLPASSKGSPDWPAIATAVRLWWRRPPATAPSRRSRGGPGTAYPAEADRTDARPASSLPQRRHRMRRQRSRGCRSPPGPAGAAGERRFGRVTPPADQSACRSRACPAVRGWCRPG